MFYRVVVLGVSYSVTDACTGAHHKNACGIQRNTEGAAIGGLLLHCHTAAGKVVDADALALGQAEDMQLTAADAESDVGRILCAWGRVYACNGELAEADILDISIGVNDVSAVGGGDCRRGLVEKAKATSVPFFRLRITPSSALAPRTQESRSTAIRLARARG